MTRLRRIAAPRLPKAHLLRACGLLSRLARFCRITSLANPEPGSGTVWHSPSFIVPRIVASSCIITAGWSPGHVSGLSLLRIVAEAPTNDWTDASRASIGKHSREPREIQLPLRTLRIWR
jgi:hypothetical protein